MILCWELRCLVMDGPGKKSVMWQSGKERKAEREEIIIK